MIIKEVVQEKPQDEVGQAVAQDVVLKSIPEKPLADYCLCDLGIKECNYKELAFFGGADEFENDYTSFFVNIVDATDVVRFVLINLKDNTELELTNANQSQYGVYSEDENHKGVKVNFDDLINNYDTNLREVKFKIQQTVFGTLVTTESHEFVLTQYNPERANGTVRVETINNGRIESGNDYGDLNWQRSVRIRGFFGRETPTIVTDNYQDGERTLRQIQDKIETEYTLETELIPSNIFKGLIYNDMLANSVKISDYNLTNVNYKGLNVQPVAVSSQYFEKNANGNYEITFTDRVQNHVKRNV
jgi:hypothetical protein